MNYSLEWTPDAKETFDDLCQLRKDRTLILAVVAKKVLWHRGGVGYSYPHAGFADDGRAIVFQRIDWELDQRLGFFAATLKRTRFACQREIPLLRDFS